jgi:DnaD/phage-associated family protein
MARKRMIDPGFWIDEKLGTCEPMARFTFMGLISQADDEGRLNGHPALIKSLLFPYDYGISPEHVEEWLNTLHSKGLIVRYEVSGQSYISIPKFLKHQTINKPTKSKLPAPPLENQGPTGGDDNDPAPLPEYSGSTPSEEKRKEEEREEKRKEAEAEGKGQTTANPFQFYEQNFGVLGSYIAEQIDEWCKDLSDDLVIEAMKRALSQNNRKWGYVTSILRDWHGKGIKTVADAKAEQMEHQHQKSRKVVPIGSKAVLADKLPASVQWQQEQERSGAAMQPVQETRTVADDPELAEMLRNLHRSKKAGS